MDNLPDKWLRTEIELNQRHEAILVEREALLAGHKASLKNHDLKTKCLRKELEMAKERNQQFLDEVELFDKKMQSRRRQLCDASSEFEVLKARYWEIVMRELSSL